MGTWEISIPIAARIPEAVTFKIADMPKATAHTKPVDMTQAPATAVVVPTKVARLNKVMNCSDAGRRKFRKLALERNIIILDTMARSWSPIQPPPNHLLNIPDNIPADIMIKIIVMAIR
jgi:hypothetical protein